MRKQFILYRITAIPGGGNSISYLKSFRANRPVYTMLKSEAGRYHFLKAVLLSLRYSLSTLPERLA